MALTLRRWLAIFAIVVSAGGLVLLAVPPFRSAALMGVEYLRLVGPTDVRFCVCGPDVETSIETPRGLTLPLSVYRSSGRETRGTVVLVHGNLPSGRRHPLYRVLGEKLSDRGFRVAAPDLGGFGDSENPFTLEGDPGYEFADDVRAVVRHVGGDRSERGRDGSELLILIGHSMGATPSLRVGLAEPGVAGIVAIGPPRRVRERMRSPEDRSYFWERAKRTHAVVYGTGFPSWFTKEDWLPVKLREALENLRPALQDPGHVPVLFLDGSLEMPADLTYLREFAEGLAPPVEHRTISGSDHYANVGNVGSVVLYDASAVGETIDSIVEWTETSVVPQLIAPRPWPPTPSRGGRGDGRTSRTRSVRDVAGAVSSG